MDSTKLKLKIGEHEFEAEGPPDIVQAQFEAFRQLVSAAPSKPSTTPPAPPSGVGNEDVALDKIMQHDSRIVSLTIGGESLQDEVLLLLLGQMRFRQNESVTGGEILEGLRQQRGTVGRIDYRLAQMADAGMIRSFGTRRARRYRLTNQGLTRAQELAATLARNVP